jgi:hypothetical protein
MAPSAEQPVLARQIEIISDYLHPRRTADRAREER